MIDFGDRRAVGHSRRDAVGDVRGWDSDLLVAARGNGRRELGSHEPREALEASVDDPDLHPVPPVASLLPRRGTVQRRGRAPMGSLEGPDDRGHGEDATDPGNVSKSVRGDVPLDARQPGSADRETCRPEPASNPLVGHARELDRHGDLLRACLPPGFDVRADRPVADSDLREVTAERSRRLAGPDGSGCDEQAGGNQGGAGRSDSKAEHCGLQRGRLGSTSAPRPAGRT